MSRKIARDAAMRMLYAYELTGELNENIIQETIEPTSLDAEDLKYLNEVTQGTVAHRPQLDTLIEQHAVGWRLSRIGKVDLSILRLALFEMLYQKDVPESVAINEAVELSKKYSDVKSKQFINGILGSISRLQNKEKEEQANESVAGD